MGGVSETYKDKKLQSVIHCYTNLFFKMFKNETGY